MKRRYGRNVNVRPTRTWVSLNAGWTLNTAVPSLNAIMSLEAPTSLALTSDPPEDITILRMIGDMTVSISGATGSWILGLIVQDATWSQGASFAADADKRWLWSSHFQSSVGAVTWASGTLFNSGGEPVGQTMQTHLDIQPKVKVEAGKSLYLVCYELAGATTLVTTMSNGRLLFQRSGRR